MSVDKILIIRLSSIGDVLLTTPVIKMLRDNYPQAQISYLVEDKAKDMVSHNPYLNQVFVFNKSKFKRIRQNEGFLAAFRFILPLIKRIKSENFDLVLDLHSVFRSSLFSFLANTPRRIGFKKQLSSIVYTDRLTVEPGEHVVDEYLKALIPLEIDPVVEEKDFSIATREKDSDYVDRLLRKLGVDCSKKIIAFNPATSSISKNWSEEKFAELGDQLNAKYDLQLLILGSAADQTKVEKIINKMKSRAFNLCGKTSLKELVEVIKRLDLLITGDTGPMHMAMAVKTPIIALFGPTSPNRFGPYQGNHLVIKSPNDDINRIGVETVINNTKMFLD